MKEKQNLLKKKLKQHFPPQLLCCYSKKKKKNRICIFLTIFIHMIPLTNVTVKIFLKAK